MTFQGKKSLVIDLVDDEDDDEDACSESKVHQNISKYKVQDLQLSSEPWEMNFEDNVASASVWDSEFESGIVHFDCERKMYNFGRSQEFQASYENELSSFLSQEYEYYYSQSNLPENDNVESTNDIEDIFLSQDELPLLSLSQITSADTKKLTKRTMMLEQKRKQEIWKEENGKYKYEELGILYNQFFDSCEVDAVLNVIHNTTSFATFPYIWENGMNYNMFQWSFRKKSNGGAASRDAIGVQLLDLIVVLFPSKEFIRLSNKGVSHLYHSIKTLIDQCQKSRYCIPNARFIISIIALDVELVAWKREFPRNALCNIDDIVATLLYEYNIEVMLLKSITEFGELLVSYSNILAKKQYHHDDEDLIEKMPRRKVPCDLVNSSDIETFELKEIWGAVLQLLPMMSREKARNFISNPNLSSPQALYSHLNEDYFDRQSALHGIQHYFSNTGKKRCDIKLASVIFKIMTCENELDSLEDSVNKSPQL